MSTPSQDPAAHGPSAPSPIGDMGGAATYRPRRPDDGGNRFPPFAIVTCALAGFAGAAAWAYIALWTEREFSALAIGVGFLVGIAAAVCGSRGIAAGLFCALVAAASIAGGKVWSVHLFVDKAMNVRMEGGELFSRAAYDEEVGEAKKYAALTTDEERAAYFIESGMVDEEEELDAAGKLKPEALADYKENLGATYERVASGELDYDTWRAEREKMLQNIIGSIHKSIDPWTALKESLEFIDIAFFAFGCMVAFAMGANLKKDDEAEPETPATA